MARGVALFKVFDGNTLVDLIWNVSTTANAPIPTQEEKEFMRIFTEHKQLQAANAKLREEYKDYERLEEICDQNDCRCDTGPPWNKCIRCTAAHALNECGETVGEALQEIDQALTEKKGE